ncbi:MAG: serine/threonine-protein kinase [Ktedonobacterales bacterium]
MGEQDSGLTPDAESDALIGTTLGGFQLTSLLGAGGMAEVYRGYDPQLERDVAVKVLPQHVARDPRYVARFRNEAQRVAALHHPNVVPIFHFGEERGLLYLVMPILKESLRDRVTREGTLEPVEAVFLAVEVAMALDAAHSQGVVHRDVKPENILLNDAGMPLLSDFGIAREVEVLRDPTAARTLATSGMPVGTPAYMAPELLRASAADHRVDVYSLGIVLYEMLTGRLPYDGVTAFDVAAKVLTEAPQRPAEFNPVIWPELEEVVLGAMASDPESRYPDISSLAEALRQAALARSTGVSRALTAASLHRTSGSVTSGHSILAGMPPWRRSVALW